MPHTALSDPIAGLISDLEALPSRQRLSDSDTEVIYAFGYQEAAQGRFEPAHRYFSLLTLYRPTSVKYLAGLAWSCKKLQRYAEAVGLYAFMALIEPDAPQHHLAIAECLLLQGETQQARDTLALVMRFCEKNPGHEPTAERAATIAALVSRQTADAA